MVALNFPGFDFKFRQDDNNREYIWDSFRKKYVALTPEEWVRQHIARYLTEYKKYPESLLLLEAVITINSMKKRADIVAYSKSGDPFLLVECKAPSVAINEKVFHQVVQYNWVLKVPYILVSNGLQHFSCKIDYIKQVTSFLEDIPDYDICLPTHD